MWTKESVDEDEEEEDEDECVASKGTDAADAAATRSRAAS
jgi:hypothetical protein